jgi:protein-tyrosine-phosphatase
MGERKVLCEIENHQDAFILNRIDLPDPRRYAGEEYLPVLAEVIKSLAAWIRKEV